MGYLSKNIFPGEQGMVFTINTKNPKDMAKVKALLSKLNQIESVVFDQKAYPHEMTVNTVEVLKVEELQNALIPFGFHALPKTLPGL